MMGILRLFGILFLVFACMFAWVGGVFYLGSLNNIWATVAAIILGIAFFPALLVFLAATVGQDH